MESIKEQAQQYIEEKNQKKYNEKERSATIAKVAIEDLLVEPFMELQGIPDDSYDILTPILSFIERAKNDKVIL